MWFISTESVRPERSKDGLASLQFRTQQVRKALPVHLRIAEAHLVELGALQV